MPRFVMDFGLIVLDLLEERPSTEEEWLRAAPARDNAIVRVDPAWFSKEERELLAPYVGLDDPDELPSDQVLVDEDTLEAILYWSPPGGNFPLLERTLHAQRIVDAVRAQDQRLAEREEMEREAEKAREQNREQERQERERRDAEARRERERALVALHGSYLRPGDFVSFVGYEMYVWLPEIWCDKSDRGPEHDLSDHAIEIDGVTFLPQKVTHYGPFGAPLDPRFDGQTPRSLVERLIDYAKGMRVAPEEVRKAANLRAL